jgi:deaminated glutathione amidase
MRIALLQLNVSDNPAANLEVTMEMVRRAHAGGAEFILTPECTNGLSSSRAHQRDTFRHEGSDLTLAELREEVAKLGVWLLIGSLGLKVRGKDGRFANRSLLIGPDGGIVARYDKIHMFDVNVSDSEVYRESAAYRPGSRAVLAETAIGRIGMTVCYDVRFPQLYRRLAQAGAQVITVPSAFNHITGAAHWETLLRARAIENGCFILAPAQAGQHLDSVGKGRRTHGHSLAISPWGEVLVDGGTEPGISFADLDLDAVARARARIPSLSHDRAFSGPRKPGGT